MRLRWLNNILDGKPPKDHGVIEINGVLEGAIRQANEVLVTPSGRVYGRIEARNVEIAGMVQGDVEAETLVIHSSGRLYYGKLKCRHLSVTDGGTMVNNGEGEGQEASEVVKGIYAVNTSDSEGVPEGTGEKAVVPEARDQASNSSNPPGNVNGEFSLCLAGPADEPQPDYSEARALQGERQAPQAGEQKPQRDRKQPHFYSSY